MGKTNSIVCEQDISHLSTLTPACQQNGNRKKGEPLRWTDAAENRVETPAFTVAAILLARSAKGGYGR